MTRHRKENVGPGLLLTAVLLMYVRFLPIDTETFPVLLLLVVALYYAVFASRGTWVLRGDNTMMILFALCLFAYSIVALVTDPSHVAVVAKYWIGPLILLALYLSRTRFVLVSLTPLLVVLVGLTILAILGFAPVTQILSMLIPRNTFTFGFRGISVLTPEPSYFAHFAMLLFVVAEHSFRTKVMSKSARDLAVLLISALVVLSASMFGILVLLGYWSWRIAMRNAAILLLPLASLVLVFVFADLFPDNRLRQVILSVRTTLLGGGDILTLLFFADPSGSTRIILNTIGISAMFIAPFGTGIGTFGANFQAYGRSLGLPVDTHEVISALDPANVVAQTYFANAANDVGVFSLLMISAVVVYCWKSRSRTKYVVLYFLLLCELFQSQISNPVPWILIYIVSRWQNEETLDR